MVGEAMVGDCPAEVLLLLLGSPTASRRSSATISTLRVISGRSLMTLFLLDELGEEKSEQSEEEQENNESTVIK